jgi:hypothetical protein
MSISLLLAFACVRDDRIVSVLKNILSFIVFVLSKHDALHAQSSPDDCVCQEERDHVPEIVKNAIEPWIVSFGGLCFGGNSSGKEWKRRAKIELQVSMHLCNNKLFEFSVEHPCHVPTYSFIYSNTIIIAMLQWDGRI